MAALTSAGVVLYPATSPTATQYPPAEWFPLGKDDRRIITRRFLLTLTGQGGAANTIGAAVLGFTYILEVSALWDAQNSKGYPAVIDPINNVIILLDGSAAPAPVDVTSNAAYITVTGTVKGPSAT
jgi:hypothetical protein